MIRYKTSYKTRFPSFDDKKLFLGTKQPIYWKMTLMGKGYSFVQYKNSPFIL